MSLREKLTWGGVTLLGALAFAIIALARGEPINAAWLVIAATCTYVIAYRFYAYFITGKVFGVDSRRMTPAYRRNDGLDYVPPTRWVLFGHHFAAIAGAGPLVGPVPSMNFVTCAICSSGRTMMMPMASRRMVPIFRKVDR